MKNFRIILAFHATLFSMLFFVKETRSQVQEPHFVSVITNSKAYYDYLPQGYNSETQKYPLIIFVHGIGELGWGTPASLPNVLINGLPRIIKDGQFPNTFTVGGEVFKFIVLSPQFISWPTPTDIEELIVFASGRYRVDVNRIYLTGLSMGGGVVWEYAAKKAEYANSLAAILPVCGVAPSDAVKGQVIASANLPVWATHNDRDGAVEVRNTNDFIRFINSSTPPPTPLAKKTIFNSDSHDAWSVTYNPLFKENGMNVYEWMLQYKKRGVTPLPNQAPSAAAGADLNITLPVNNVTLAGSGTDVDGTISKYSWTKISGPSQFTINNEALPNPSITNLAEGEYSFRLTVTDNNNATNYDDMIVKVNATTSITLVPGIIQAENYLAMNGVMTENTTDAGGGKNVGWIDNGDWMDYRINVTTAGTYPVNYRVATPYSNQQFQVRKSDGTVLATINVPKTGANQSWATVSGTLSLQAGIQTIRIHSLQSGWNFNWAELSALQPVASIPGKLQAEDYSTMSGVQSENTTDAGGGYDVGWIDNNDWMDYQANVSNAGIYTVNFRVATPYANQKFELRKSNGTVLATIIVPTTGGNQTWATVSASINLDAGAQTIRIYSLQSGWNINWVEFLAGSSAVPVPGIVEAANFTAMSGVLTEDCLDTGGGRNVGWIDNGDWMDYIIDVANADTYKINFRVATPYASQKFQLRNSSGTVLANINVPVTGGNQVWTTVSANVVLQKGNQTVRLHSTQSGWNIRRIEIIDETPLSSLDTYRNELIGSETLISDKSSIGIFPNPVENHVMLKIDNKHTGPLSVQIMDQSGKIAKTVRFSKNLPVSQLNLRLNELPAGTYFLKIQMKEWSDVRKMVKL